MDAFKCQNVTRTLLMEKNLYLPKITGPVLQFILPMLLFASYVTIAIFSDLRTAAPEMLAVTALITVLITATAYWGDTTKHHCSPYFILAVAAGIRCLFVFHDPQLSDDVYRYLLDGSHILAGQNPYGIVPKNVPPTNVALATLAVKVNHPHLTTIYPPAAQILFALGTWLGGMTGLKLLFIVMDLVLVAFIIRITSILGISSWWTILYAWHPLPVLEIAASGHVDGAGLTALFAAFYFLRPSENPTKPKRFQNGRLPEMLRFVSAGFLYAVAVLVKLFPVVFLPLAFCIIRKRQFIPFLAGLISGCFLLLYLFLPDIFQSLHTLHLYAATWEFSGFIFQTLRGLGLEGITARTILAAAFCLLSLYCYRKATHLKNDDISVQEKLATILTAQYLISFGFLLLTPTLHPWYGLYMLVFLPFTPSAGGIILTWSILLGYNVLVSYALLNQWTENSLIPVLIWFGPAMAMSAAHLRRRHLSISGTRRRWSR